MKKILVVDDDPDVGRFLKVKLESSQRFVVISATAGKEALRLAESEQPDILLCDVDMPDMDGGEVAAAIATREATKHIPVIFFSSLITPGEVSRGASAGRWPVISKQSPLEDLVKKIDEVLARVS